MAVCADSLTQVTLTAALDASNYPAQKSGRSGLSRTAAPLLLAFLQEVISGRHRLPHRDPGVPAPSAEQRTAAEQRALPLLIAVIRQKPISRVPVCMRGILSCCYNSTDCHFLMLCDFADGDHRWHELCAL
jgi:hypothetical protein